MTIEDLLEIESIRRQRMLFSFHLDAGELDALADLFVEDALCEFGPFGTWRGKAEIRRNYEPILKAVGGFRALHANTNHWVELAGPDKARGRVYLIDLILTRPKDQQPIVWLGVYDEAYEKVEGTWKIARTSLQLMWPERHVSPEFPGDRAVVQA